MLISQHRITFELDKIAQRQGIAVEDLLAVALEKHVDVYVRVPRDSKVYCVDLKFVRGEFVPGPDRSSVGYVPMRAELDGFLLSPEDGQEMVRQGRRLLTFFDCGCQISGRLLPKKLHASDNFLEFHSGAAVEGGPYIDTADLRIDPEFIEMFFPAELPVVEIPIAKFAMYSRAIQHLLPDPISGFLERPQEIEFALSDLFLLKDGVEALDLFKEEWAGVKEEESLIQQVTVNDDSGVSLSLKMESHWPFWMRRLWEEHENVWKSHTPGQLQREYPTQNDVIKALKEHNKEAGSLHLKDAVLHDAATIIRPLWARQQEAVERKSAAAQGECEAFPELIRMGIVANKIYLRQREEKPPSQVEIEEWLKEGGIIKGTKVESAYKMLRKKPGNRISTRVASKKK